jgi:hypothetical protein
MHRVETPIGHIPILRYPSRFFNPTWLTGHNIYGGEAHRNSWHRAFGFHLYGSVFSKGPLTVTMLQWNMMVNYQEEWGIHHFYSMNSWGFFADNDEIS